jgi:predicted DNA binding CopG/RHH family protein
MTIKLDAYEKEIEKKAERYRPVSKRKRKRIEYLIDRARKSRNINIRISESDLEELKLRAKDEGLPYQTLIASVLHKYIRRLLVDEKAIRDAISLLH